jgi:hypothetical protein
MGMVGHECREIPSPAYQPSPALKVLQVPVIVREAAWVWLPGQTTPVICSFSVHNAVYNSAFIGCIMI